MKLSIIILNYNVRYFLELCIKSVQAAIGDLDAEIIVVDNNSTDESCAMITRFFPEVILIENTENLGFSKGNNIGVAHAKGEYLCIMNPDTVVAEDTFAQLMDFANVQSNMGILGCQLIDGRGQFLLESKRKIPTPMVSIKKILGFPESYYVNTIEPDAIGEVDILVGAFMMVKKSIFEEVGGFDEDYFMYGEDVDLSFKIMKAGYQNFYYGATKVIHYKGESTLKDKVYAKRFYGAMQIFYKKHFKSNFLFNAMVWFASRFLQTFLRAPKQLYGKVKFYVSISEHAHFNSQLPFPAELKTDLNDVNAHSRIVFDGNTIAYKTIIEYMSASDKAMGLTFRILPKSSTFLLGSDSSEQRGEVIHLEKIGA